MLPSPSPNHKHDRTAIVVAGSIAIDLGCDFAPINPSGQEIGMHTSNPARIHETLGGVACNIARACHYAGAKTLLCSVTGNDLAAQSIHNVIQATGMTTTGLLRGQDGSRTARYIAVNDLDKNLVVAMADMDIIEAEQGDFDEKWMPLLRANKP